MSIIKSIKQVLGLSGTSSENHFWDGSVANQLSLKRGVPDAPGDEIIKVLNGVLSFPNQGQTLAQNGVIKLPGGLIVQWGRDAGGAGDHDVIYPIAFPNAVLAITASANSLAGLPTNAAVVIMTSVSGSPNTRFYAQPRYSNNGPQGVASEPFYWIALGH